MAEIGQREKEHVRMRARRALAAGEIKRERCRSCGSHDSEMHHPDYSQPLAVEWYCHSCHLRLHPERPRNPTPYPELRGVALTEAEWDIVDATMRGERPAEIASTLHVSLKTVYWRRLRIRGKVEASTWAQAVGLAMLNGRPQQDTVASADVEELMRRGI